MREEETHAPQMDMLDARRSFVSPVHYQTTSDLIAVGRRISRMRESSAPDTAPELGRRSNMIDRTLNPSLANDSAAPAVAGATPVGFLHATAERRFLTFLGRLASRGVPIAENFPKFRLDRNSEEASVLPGSGSGGCWAAPSASEDSLVENQLRSTSLAEAKSRTKSGARRRALKEGARLVSSRGQRSGRRARAALLRLAALRVVVGTADDGPSDSASAITPTESVNFADTNGR